MAKEDYKPEKKSILAQDWLHINCNIASYCAYIMYI